jgi:subtilase family serine protease
LQNDRKRYFMSLREWRHLCTVLLAALFFLMACSTPGNSGSGESTVSTAASRPSPAATSATIPQVDTCPSLTSGYPPATTFCYTPHQLEVAYSLDALLKQGFTGKGQTVVDIVSFGSPTLQEDMNVFDRQFGLPAIQLQIIAPLGTKPFDSNNQDMVGWAGETTLDVQAIHATAPQANIVVLTSPVSETESTVGLPEFLQLEQYALDHHLGNIISQSWGASEATLKDTASQQEIQKWHSFFQKTTTQQGVTYLASSGDNGAADVTDMQVTQPATIPTIGFPADDPWVTSVGGTTVARHGTSNSESAWNKSEGGFSAFFASPSYQLILSPSVQSQAQHRRGVPDVAADADPSTGLAFYKAGAWSLAGGTSASAPLWAGLIAIANQMAGHPLGFINPAIYKVAGSANYARDFHDIIVGNNNVAEECGIVTGYTATQGWDAITGWGSPDAAHLLPDLVAAMK